MKKPIVLLFPTSVVDPKDLFRRKEKNTRHSAPSLCAVCMKTHANAWGYIPFQKGLKRRIDNS